MIVVFDASAFISAALIEPDKLILSRAVEDEYAPRSAQRFAKRTVSSPGLAQNDVVSHVMKAGAGPAGEIALGTAADTGICRGAIKA